LSIDAGTRQIDKSAGDREALQHMFQAVQIHLPHAASTEAIVADGIEHRGLGGEWG
jgi:hypothetical protein